jgi:hypothetical protein
LTVSVLWEVTKAFAAVEVVGRMEGEVLICAL